MLHSDRLRCRTSVGALIGAGFCAGVPLEKMQRDRPADELHRLWPLDPFLARTRNQPALEKYLARLTPATTFAELKRRWHQRHRHQRGVTVYYLNGAIATPLRASCAYPGLFVPIQYEGRTLVDGF